MSFFNSAFLRAAQVLGSKDWSHPDILRLARHMAHEGASVEEIAAACGWTVTRGASFARLKKLNIAATPKIRHRVKHYGADPYLPPSNRRITGLSYRPKRMRASA